MEEQNFGSADGKKLDSRDPNEELNGLEHQIPPPMRTLEPLNWKGDGSGLKIFLAKQTQQKRATTQKRRNLFIFFASRFVVPKIPKVMKVNNFHEVLTLSN
jgi:hypothetical protein